MIKDYENENAEYTRLLSCFIRDVRKDLKAPDMPFVIGVMGIGGPDDKAVGKQASFRKAQAATAAMPEFKGNVVAVSTGDYWDMELLRIDQKLAKAAEEKVKAENPDMKPRALKKATGQKAKSMAAEVLTPEEMEIREKGKSNQAFHYMGSALTFGGIGKAFADAMHELSLQK